MKQILDVQEQTPTFIKVSCFCHPVIDVVAPLIALGVAASVTAEVVVSVVVINVTAVVFIVAVFAVGQSYDKIRFFDPSVNFFTTKTSGRKNGYGAGLVFANLSFRGVRFFFDVLSVLVTMEIED